MMNDRRWPPVRVRSSQLHHKSTTSTARFFTMFRDSIQPFLIGTSEDKQRYILMMITRNFRQTALLLVTILGLTGLGLALFELLSPTSGTAGSAGATLVLVSTALLAATAALLAFVHLKRWLFGLLLTLSVIDAAATAVAAYFLMANVLVATMLLALLAGLAAAFAGSRQGRMTT
ncbi:hypothetical protein [Sulfitobacter sp. 1A12779]|jgi:hypothetical protein